MSPTQRSQLNGALLTCLLRVSYLKFPSSHIVTLYTVSRDSPNTSRAVQVCPCLGELEGEGEWKTGICSYNEYKLCVSVHVSVHVCPCEVLLRQSQSCLPQGHLHAVMVAMATHVLQSECACEVKAHVHTPLVPLVLASTHAGRQCQIQPTASRLPTPNGR